MITSLKSTSSQYDLKIVINSQIQVEKELIQILIFLFPINRKIKNYLFSVI